MCLNVDWTKKWSNIRRFKVFETCVKGECMASKILSITTNKEIKGFIEENNTRSRHANKYVFILKNIVHTIM